MIAQINFITKQTIIDIMLLIKICKTLFNQNCLYIEIGIYLINIAVFPLLEIAVIDTLITENNICNTINIIQNPSTFKFKLLNNSNTSSFFITKSNLKYIDIMIPNIISKLTGKIYCIRKVTFLITYLNSFFI